jgi:general nucleoside transport system permease protein
MLEAAADAPQPSADEPVPPDGSKAHATAKGPPDWVVAVGLYALCIGVALVASAVLVAVTGGPWQSVLSALIDGSVRNPGRWGATLAEAAPILIVALGAIVSTRAGLINIGQEGQLAIGAACAAYVATRSSGAGALVAALAVAIVGGAVWAGIAAVLRFWRKVPEVITTLLLVFVAAQLTGYALTRQFLLLDRDPNRPNRTQTSGQLDADTQLPTIRLFGNEFPITVVIAVALAAATAVLINRSTWGFKLRLVGFNPRTAQRAGVSAVVVGCLALAIGGGLAGLAGGLMLTGGVANYRYTPGFANNVGWEGLLVALVARNSPLIAIPVAVVFGALRTGGGFLASTGVEREIVDVVRGLLVLALLVPPALMAVRARRRAAAAGGEPVDVAPTGALGAGA